MTLEIRDNLPPGAARVLAYIEARNAAGEFPTLREVSDHCEWKSTATAAEVIKYLRKLQLLQRPRKRGWRKYKITQEKP